MGAVSTAVPLGVVGVGYTALASRSKEDVLCVSAGPNVKHHDSRHETIEISQLEKYDDI